MERFNGQRMLWFCVILSVVGAMQTHGAFITQPVPPSVLGWMLIGFAVVMLIARACTRGPVPALERRAHERPLPHPMSQLGRHL